MHKSPPRIYQTRPRHLLEALAQDEKKVQEKVLRKDVRFLAQEPSRRTPTAIARTIFYKSIANKCRKKGPILWFIQYAGRIVERETGQQRRDKHEGKIGRHHMDCCSAGSHAPKTGCNKGGGEAVD